MQQMFNYEESFGKWGSNPRKYRYISDEPIKVGDLIDVRNVKDPQVVKAVVTTIDKGNWRRPLITRLPDGRIDEVLPGEPYVVYSNVVTI